MKLIRVGDGYSHEKNFITASNYGAEIQFWGFGKGKERGSDFRLRLNIEDIVLIVAKMADGGHETAKWLEDAMRLNNSLEAVLKQIDEIRQVQREENDEDERLRQQEDEEFEREWQAKQSNRNEVT